MRRGRINVSPTSKWQSWCGKHPTSSQRKKLKTVRTGKVFGTIFWDVHALLVDFRKCDPTGKDPADQGTLQRLRCIIHHRVGDRGFLHGVYCCYTIILGFMLLAIHVPRLTSSIWKFPLNYAPGLLFLNFYLFSQLKKFLQDKRFPGDDAIQQNVVYRFNIQEEL